MPHFQLVTTDGTVLGARELGRPDWPLDVVADITSEIDLDGGLCLVTADGEWRAEGVSAP